MSENNNKRTRDGSVGSSDDDEGYSTSSSYAPSAIDVSFNYCSPTEIDFMAIKRLIQQLYHTNSDKLNLTGLSDHIITLGKEQEGIENTIGTVVKVEDDEDGDPFAFASMVNLSSQEDVAGKTLKKYYEEVLGKSSSSSSSKSILNTLHDKNSQIIQIFHERMINLPPQIMPPLYKMLFEEIELSKELKPTHFLFFSRVFSTEAFSDGEDEEEEKDSQNGKGKGKSNGKRSKKAKKTGSTKPINQAITKMKSSSTDEDQQEVGLFHPEDSILAKYATNTFTFKFPAIKDSDDSFNAPMFGRIVLIKNDSNTITKLLEEITSEFSLEV